MSANSQRRSRIDRLSGLAIRAASLIVLLAVVGMPLQMFTVAWPLLAPSDVTPIVAPDDAAENVAAFERTPAWVPRHGVVGTWSETNRQRLWMSASPSGELQGRRLRAHTFVATADDTGLSSAENWVSESVNLPNTIAAADFLMIDPAQRWLIALRRDGRYGITGLTPGNQGFTRGQVAPFDAIVALPGSRAVLLASGAAIRQLQLLRSPADNQPELALMREWVAEAAIAKMAPAPTGQRVLIATKAPGWVLWHSTTNRVLASGALAADAEDIGWGSSQTFYISGANSGRHYWRQQETRGATSLSSLFGPVLYEGYSAPAQVWQSTAHASGYEAKYGLMPLVLGTFKAAIYAMLLAIPLALGAAIFVGFFMPPVIRDRIKPAIELLEAFPTVVLGALTAVWLAPRLFGILAPALGALLVIPLGLVVSAMMWRRYYPASRTRSTLAGLPLLLIPVLIGFGSVGAWVGSTLESFLPTGALVPWLESSFDIHSAQRNAVLVGVAMGLAVFPGIFSMAEDAIHAVPRNTAAGSLALGASHWQSYRDVILPVALPGMISAITLGFGRAMGETMIVLMVAGNTPIMDWNILEGMRTISASLAIELPESAFESIHYRVLFLAAMLLFCLTFVFNTLAELLRMRMYRRYGGQL